MKTPLKIKVIEPCDPELCFPSFSNEYAAGLDLRTPYYYRIDRHSTSLIRTGIAVEIPVGFCGMVVPRSGLGFNYGTKLKNTVGIIDSDYRGEIILNMGIGTDIFSFQFAPGERIAQMIIVPVLNAQTLELVQTYELSETSRNDSGFGSTGK